MKLHDQKKKKDSKNKSGLFAEKIGFEDGEESAGEEERDFNRRWEQVEGPQTVRREEIWTLLVAILSSEIV